MDQDFYIEETSPLKIFITILVFILIIAGGLYYYYNYRKENVVKLKNITVELGMPLSKDINSYIECAYPERYKLDLSNISIDENGNTNSTGEYSYKIIKNNEIKKGKLYVKDTTPPVVETQELTVGVNEEFDPSEFVSKCDDLSLPCIVKYKNNSEAKINNNEGTYNIDIIVSDNEGNSIKKNVTLHVSGTDTLKSTKASDLNFDHLSENDESWNQTYTLKLEKAISEESLKYDELIENISTKDYNFDKEISNKKIIVVYNKYNYVLGFSVKITFNDNTVLYVTNENTPEQKEN